MADESQYFGNDGGTTASSDTSSATPVGYCQECGTPLTAGTLRRNAHGVFCAPCVAQRQASPAWQTVNISAFGAAPGARPQSPGDSNPVFASVLGFIPGVGAMYNGQYAKGAMHLIVFVVLVSLADNLTGAFYWFVWGWVFYQAFDAYHTARARRDGLPLPNPFGWNDIGERFGFARASTGPVVTGPPPTPAAAAASTAPQPEANWAGYVPRREDASAPPQVAYADGPRPATDNPYTAPFAAVPGQERENIAEVHRRIEFVAHRREKAMANQDYRKAHFYAEEERRERERLQGYSQSSTGQAANGFGAMPMGGPASTPNNPPPTGTPYVPTYTGATPGAQMPPPSLVVPTRRFPIGALWLIGLGLLFLIGNVMPEWRMNGRWLVPVLLAAAAAWSAVRRWEQFRTASLTVGASPNFAGAMTGPAVLLTLAVLFTLQAGDVLGLHRSWPVLLVVWGSMLLMQRASAPIPPTVHPDFVGSVAPPPQVRSTSGTGSLGL